MTFPSSWAHVRVDAAASDLPLLGCVASMWAYRGDAPPKAIAMDREVGNREDRLREEHGLTPKESRIVLHLIDGGTVQSCAEALDVAESTIRSHLKSVFAKTGVRRQAHLGRLLIQNAGD